MDYMDTHAPPMRHWQLRHHQVVVAGYGHLLQLATGPQLASGGSGLLWLWFFKFDSASLLAICQGLPLHTIGWLT